MSRKIRSGDFAARSRSRSRRVVGLEHVELVLLQHALRAGRRWWPSRRPPARGCRCGHCARLLPALRATVVGRPGVGGMSIPASSTGAGTMATAPAPAARPAPACVSGNRRRPSCPSGLASQRSVYLNGFRLSDARACRSPAPPSRTGGRCGPTPAPWRRGWNAGPAAAGRPCRDRRRGGAATSPGRTAQPDQAGHQPRRESTPPGRRSSSLTPRATGPSSTSAGARLRRSSRGPPRPWRASIEQQAADAGRCCGRRRDRTEDRVFVASALGRLAAPTATRDQQRRPQQQSQHQTRIRSGPAHATRETRRAANATAMNPAVGPAASTRYAANGHDRRGHAPEWRKGWGASASPMA